MLRFSISILLIAAFTAFGEFSFGVNFSGNISNTTTNGSTTPSSENSSGSNSFEVIPFVGIHAGSIVEISPYLGWDITSTSTNGENSSRHQSLEPGCGFYFHAIKNNVFDVSLGPKLGYRFNFKPSQSDYYSYYNGVASIGCQFNIDLLFSKVFASRLSASLFNYSYSSYTYKVTSTSTASKSHTTNFNFKSIFQPSFGFLFTF